MSKSIPTVHITDGKSFKVVNESDFKSGSYKGFKLVSEKAKKAKEVKPSKKDK